MRHLPAIALLMLTAACHAVGSNPWMGVDYAEMNCGTKEAVLTTTGCITTPAATPVARPVASPANTATAMAGPPPAQRDTDIYNNGVLDRPPPPNDVYNNHMNRQDNMHNNTSTNNDVHTTGPHSIQQENIHNNSVTGVTVNANEGVFANDIATPNAVGVNNGVWGGSPNR